MSVMKQKLFTVFCMIIGVVIAACILMLIGIAAAILNYFLGGVTSLKPVTTCHNHTVKVLIRELNTSNWTEEGGNSSWLINKTTGTQLYSRADGRVNIFASNQNITDTPMSLSYACAYDLDDAFEKHRSETESKPVVAAPIVETTM